MDVLRRVLEFPRSVDARRKLAAAWLHSGHPRSALMERQLRQHDGLPLSEIGVVGREIRQLLRDHGREGAGRVADITTQYDYELGLVAAISITGDKWLQHGAELVRIAPIVRIHFQGPVDLAVIGQTSALKNVSRFDRRCRGKDEASRDAARRNHSSLARRAKLAGVRIRWRNAVQVVSAEILINQAAQGLRTYDEVKGWFEEHSDLDQLSLLREVGQMALQAGATPNDALSAAEQTATKLGAPAVVLMSKDAPKVQLRKVLQLPTTEYARTFVFLIGLLSVADARRRETKCRGNCTHWWHRDLNNGAVVRELLASRRSNKA